MVDSPPRSKNASAGIIAVRSYPELMTAIRGRVEAIGAPIEVIEAHAGMTNGHLGKILGLAENRRLGLFAIWPLFETLGLELWIGEHLDLAATRDEMGPIYRAATQYNSRRGKLRKQLSPAILANAARELGRRGGTIPKRFRISPAKRSKINKANIRKRWHSKHRGRN